MMETTNKYQDVQQDIVRFVRHCAMRNNVQTGFVLAEMKKVLDNNIIKP